MVLKVKKLGDSPKVKAMDEAAKKYADNPEAKASAIEKIMQGISELTGDAENTKEDASESDSSSDTCCPHCGKELS